MAYLTFGQFRAAGIQWFTKGLLLESTSEYPDAMLTAAIAAQSKRFDLLTDDHFEPPTVDTAITVLVSSIGGMAVNNVSGPILPLPRRVRTLTKVETQDYAGTYTEELSTYWRLTSSVSGVTADDVTVRGYDFLTVIPGMTLAAGSAYWPAGPQVVRLTGKFDWPACPDLVKRAVAIMVWDSLTPVIDVMRRSTSFQNAEGFYNLAKMPQEAAEIAKLYTRPRLPAP